MAPLLSHPARPLLRGLWNEPPPATGKAGAKGVSAAAKPPAVAAVTHVVAADLGSAEGRELVREVRAGAGGHGPRWHKYQGVEAYLGV